MPLRIAEHVGEPHSLACVPEQFVIFYSSVVDGKLWCPDCRDVQEQVQKTFETSDGPSALIVYVGDKTEWKSPSNIFRGEPWNLSSIPTIVRLHNGVEDARLVERDISRYLASLIVEVKHTDSTAIQGGDSEGGSVQRL